MPLAVSSDGIETGEVIFAGYGITAADLGYDDYAGLDVRDKVVLVLSQEPRPADPSSPFRRLPKIRGIRMSSPGPSVDASPARRPAGSTGWTTSALISAADIDLIHRRIDHDLLAAFGYQAVLS
jgi:hypothetical protein